MEQTGALEWKVEGLDKKHVAGASQATSAFEQLAQQVTLHGASLMRLEQVTRNPHLKQLTEGALAHVQQRRQCTYSSCKARQRCCKAHLAGSVARFRGRVDAMHGGGASSNPTRPVQAR